MDGFGKATFEIICESRPFLNKNAGCSSNTVIGRGSDNQGFQKMLQNFLIFKLVNKSFSRKWFWKRPHFFSYYITIFRVVNTLLDKNYFKYIKKQSSSNFVHMYLLFHLHLSLFLFICAKYVRPSYLFCNFHKRESLELWE